MEFNWDELQVFVKRGQMSVMSARLLSLVTEDEPALMLYWAHRKRIRPVPGVVGMALANRLAELTAEAGIDFYDLTYSVIEDVCETLWAKLSDDDRQGWLRKV